MRSTLVFGALLVACLVLAGCVGNFNKSQDPEQQASTITTPSAASALTPPVPMPTLKTSISVPADFPAWVQTGTPLDVSAAVPADGKAPFTWLWGVAPMIGTAPVTKVATGIDTGAKRPEDYLAPGESRTLTFSIAGVYAMHCHPHYQFMRSNVTVIDGLPGPMNYDVYIEDGATYKDFRFVPENITVPAGAHVTYHNVGSQAHTATMSSQDPPLTVQTLKDSKGAITLTGNGWSRVVVIVHDADGRIGQAEWNVYIAPFPETFHKTYNANFNAGTPSQADSVPVAVAPSQSFAFKTDYNGTVYINATFLDVPSQNAPAPDPANTCVGEWHLQEQGITQDTLTGQAGSEADAHGRVLTTTYNLVAQARQGVQCQGVFDVTVVYDHTPPAQLPYFDPESIPHTH